MTTAIAGAQAVRGATFRLRERGVVPLLATSPRDSVIELMRRCSTLRASRANGVAQKNRCDRENSVGPHPASRNYQSGSSLPGDVVTPSSAAAPKKWPRLLHGARLASTRRK